MTSTAKWDRKQMFTQYYLLLTLGSNVYFAGLLESSFQYNEQAYEMSDPTNQINFE